MRQTNIEAGGRQLRDLGKLNFLLGKNGCGKSILLREVEGQLTNREDWGAVAYITPERAGLLTFDAGTESNFNSTPDWARQSRRVNQLNQFKQQSMVQYRRLELSVLRGVEENVEAGNVPGTTFSSYIDRINDLLDNIEIERGASVDSGFKIYERTTAQPLEPNVISSGESELIALAIECLVFTQSLVEGKENMLFLDEPDVHLHPDLQARLSAFLIGLIDDFDFRVLIATHSTALLPEARRHPEADSRVALMVAGQTDLSFLPIDGTYEDILPVFGAHPLSNVFNDAPILLLEGEDDVRIWQQAVRSSEGALSLYPVATGSVNQLNLYENRTRDIMNAVYDDGRAYSLRDGDGVQADLDDLPPVVRLRLGCRAAENLILSDEVLAAADATWETFQERSNQWLERNPDHSHAPKFTEFREGGYDRKNFDLKALRMLIVGEMLASTKPWEVLVGQVLGSLRRSGNTDFAAEGSIWNFLGAKAANALIPQA